MVQIGARRDGCVRFQNWHPSRAARLTNHRWFRTVKIFARITSAPCSDWILGTEKKAMGEHTIKYVCVTKTKCTFASVSLSSACRHESPSHFLFHSFGMQFISPVTNSFLSFLFLPPTHPPFTSSAAHYLPPSFSVTLSWREKWWDGGIREGAGEENSALITLSLHLKS